MTPLGRARIVTLVIAGVGIFSGMLVYALAPMPAEDPLYDYVNTKSYQNGVERFGGRSALFGIAIQDAIASATHGPNLGLTIAITSALVAAVYHWRATRRLESVTHP
jgi:hypothetical protein